MRWEVHVWRTVHGEKSRLGNWYEGRFRWFWLAYLAARWMALVCDAETPEICCYGIQWGIREARP